MSNPANLLVAVSAYAGDRHQVEANLPVYRHHNVSVLILTPKNAPIETLSGSPAGVYYNFAGSAQWAGGLAVERQRMFLEMLLAAPYGFYLFHDADSVCLASDLPDYLSSSGDIFWSNEVPDTNPSASLLPKIALQPPYAFSRRVLERLVMFAHRPAVSYTEQITGEDWPLPIPTGCPDHWLLQVAHAAGVEHRSFPDGASWETTSELGLREMSRRVREDGAIFIHQVKSSNALHHLLGAHALYGKRR